MEALVGLPRACPTANSRPSSRLPSSQCHHTLAPCSSYPRSQTDKEILLGRGFACENPLWASLASWPPDQPAKLQSKATDLRRSSCMGRSRMVDLDCNLSRSVPEFFLLLLLRGAKWDECEERRWMESACAQRASVLSVLLALLASNPSIHPSTHTCVYASSIVFFTARMGPRPLGRAGAIHGLGCSSIHLALRGPDAWTGNGDPQFGSGSSKGPLGPWGPSNPVPSPKPTSRGLTC